MSTESGVLDMFPVITSLYLCLAWFAVAVVGFVYPHQRNIGYHRSDHRAIDAVYHPHYLIQNLDFDLDRHLRGLVVSDSR